MNLDQAVGSMLGLAIGDALGCTLEFTTRSSSDLRRLCPNSHYGIATGNILHQENVTILA